MSSTQQIYQWSDLAKIINAHTQPTKTTLANFIGALNKFIEAQKLFDGIGHLEITTSLGKQYSKWPICGRS